MAAPESKVKAEVRRILVDWGVYYFAPAANGYGRAGIPDIIACYRGFFIAIECKAGKGKTTALQDREIESIRKAEGIALIIREDNMHELLNILELIRARQN